MMIILSPLFSKNIFYKISEKNYSSSLSKEILLKGTFKLVQKNNREHIQEINVTKNYDNIPITKDNFIKILRKEKVFLTDETSNLTEFLKQEDIKYNFLQICKNCEKEDRFTLLSHNNKIIYDSKHICKRCAKKIIDQQIITNGFLDYTDREFDFLLEKYQNLEDILSIMEEDYNPYNKKFTLYDTLDVTEKEYEIIKINDLKIPQEFKNILSDKIDRLMPVQILSIKKGLLKDKNLLIVSQTASGKTLIGELAGIPKALNNKKMIYLSPLVALANQKYRDFKRDYEKLGLKVAIKVGHNRIKSNDELYIPDKSIKNKDIIVATYEGLDYILRSGNYHDLEDLGTVIIDEIHMLENEERGHRLNGLINRLITIFPNAQLIGLSATIKNADSLAEEFSMDLVEYNKRPVKIERHFVNVKNEKEKNKIIVNLCKKEFDTISSKGYHGQTIIFTDSRRKTQLISGKLKKKGVNAEYYHAGLTYRKKIEIEEAFINQEISTVVTTSALANGIDFPASMVIFESIHMGIEYLTNNEFHQMLGRAGRPSYHDIGKAYIITLSQKNDNDFFNSQDSQIALELLKNDVDNVNVLYDKLDVYEQILSDICAIENVDISSLKNRYDNMWIPITFNEAISLLMEKNMIFYDEYNHTYKSTEYGKAISKSFITIDEGETIKNNIYEDIIEIVLSLELVHNAYFTGSLLNKLSSVLNYNVGANIFSDRSKEIIYKGAYIDILGQKFQNKLININKELMNCNCSYPYCNCFEKNISKHIINRRIQGWSPKEISNEFKREYEIMIYPGDIFSYLDQVIMKLEAIKRISYSFNIKSTAEECERLIYKIEEGK